MNQRVREQSFPLAGLRLQAKIWHADRGRPTIALHGWLDNAGSFDRLAPLLPDLHLVALDSAGHGYSDFRSPDANYTLIQEVDEVFAVADLLGWERFDLIGHSRGAAIASLIAGTFPERITHLTLIEGISPLPMSASEAPANLAQAILEKRRLQHASGRIFSSREAALKARMDGFTKITLSAAETLAIRSLREVEGGFQWHADARLKGASEYRFTPELIFPFLQRISAPTLLIQGEQGMLVDEPGLHSFASQISGLEIVTLSGGHHLHLEGAEEAITLAMRERFTA